MIVKDRLKALPTVYCHFEKSQLYEQRTDQFFPKVRTGQRQDEEILKGKAEVVVYT